MRGVIELEESFDSCITATLTLYRFNNSPNSFSLLPMPFALNCMIVLEFPSAACVGIVAVVVSVEWVGNCKSWKPSLYSAAF